MGSGSLLIHIGSDLCSLVGGQVHATDWRHTMRGAGKRRARKTHPTVCGRQRARLLGVGTCNEKGERTGAMTVIWPPYVEEVREDGYERCPECFKLKPGKPNRMITNPYKPPRKSRTKVAGESA